MVPNCPNQSSAGSHVSGAIIGKRPGHWQPGSNSEPRSSRAPEQTRRVNRWVLSTRDKESSRPDFRGAERNHGCAVPLCFQREDSRLRTRRAQVLARLAIKTKTPRGGSSRRRALTTGYKNFATQCSTPRTQRFANSTLWRSLCNRCSENDLAISRPIRCP